MTNEERIKQMSTEELAKFIDDLTRYCDSLECKECPVGSAERCMGDGLIEWLGKECDGTGR